MSRSGYVDDFDENWSLIRWRGAVTAAIKGKRGQAFLKELEDALVALPEKKLLAGGFAKGGEVCAIGSVLVARRCKAGMTREAALAEVEAKFPVSEDGYEAPEIAPEAGIADAMAKEIMFVNDNDFPYGSKPEENYRRMLEWVREQRAKVN